MRTRWKVIAGVVLILSTLTWLAVSGIQESKTYYVTVTELQAMGDDAYSRRLRVAGDVEPGSIKREGERVSFRLVQEARILPVVYTGTEPLPDTFRDRAQALADGSYGRDGVFTAKRIQAKCASKYEAEKAGGRPGMGQTYESKPAGAAPATQQRN
jgi:cytochrome c-type biogenesis protein CcmE